MFISLFSFDKKNLIRFPFVLYINKLVKKKLNHDKFIFLFSYVLVLLKHFILFYFQHFNLKKKIIKLLKLNSAELFSSTII